MMEIKTTLATIATAIITLMLATGGIIANSAQINDALIEQEACYSAMELIGVIGEMRDDGIPPRQTVIGMVSIGVPPDTANMATYFVYEAHGDKPVEEVQEIFLGNCLGESA